MLAVIAAMCTHTHTHVQVLTIWESQNFFSEPVIRRIKTLLAVPPNELVSFTLQPIFVVSSLCVCVNRSPPLKPTTLFLFSPFPFLLD